LGTVLAQKNHYIKGIEDAIALLKTCGECSSEWLIDRLGDYKYKAEQTAQPQQEPVGKVVDCDSLGTPIVNWKTKSLAFGTKLYTSPPASKPWIRLTDNEIDECAGTDFGGVWLFDTAYAIEAKLKEKNI
jgi:hypothetical protein